MTLHLFWLDKEWQERGVARNYNLIIYLDEKAYRDYTNAFYGYHRPEDIEVKRKRDITDYIDYLKSNGFLEIKKEVA